MNNAERCPSGRRSLTRNQVRSLQGAWGSNPYLSAIFLSFSGSWRGVREAEGARLEIVCRLIPYRGFESHPLRHCGRGPYNKPRKPRQVRKEAAVADRLCVAVFPAFLLYFTDFIDYFFDFLSIFDFEFY